MAVKYWLGRAQAVAQVTRLLVTEPIVAAETWSVTINAKTITFTATTTTVADVVNGLVALLNASTIPEFAELTWSNEGDEYVVGTADVSGVPHTITPSTNSAAGDFTTDTGTDATGPNFWDNTDNWSGGTLPVGSDSIVLADSNQGIFYGWPGSSLTFVDWNVQSTFTGGGVGLPELNALGYREYRPTFPTNITITTGTMAAGSCTRMNIKALASSAALTLVSGTFNIQGSQSDSVIDVNGGTLNLGGPGLTATAATVRVVRAARLNLHKDATITTLYNSGTAYLDGAVTSYYQKEGNSYAAKNPQTLTDVRGGTCKLNGSETITALAVGPGTVDLSGDLTPFTVTSLTLRPGGNILTIKGRISNTPALTLDAGLINLRG